MSKYTSSELDYCLVPCLHIPGFFGLYVMLGHDRKIHVISTDCITVKAFKWPRFKLLFMHQSISFLNKYWFWLLKSNRLLGRH